MSKPKQKVTKDPTALLLRSFRLPTMAGQYEEVMQRAEKEGWSHRQALRQIGRAHV